MKQPSDFVDGRTIAEQVGFHAVRSTSPAPVLTLHVRPERPAEADLMDPDATRMHAAGSIVLKAMTLVSLLAALTASGFFTAFLIGLARKLVGLL